MNDRGMLPRELWEKTAVHRHSTYYCAKCGRQLPSPHDVYEHLDTEHPKRKEPKHERVSADRDRGRVRKARGRR